MARRSDRIEKEVPKYLIFPIRLDRIDLKWGSLSQLHGMFPLGQHPRGHPSLFGHYRRPQTRRYVVNLNPWRPGQQPRPWIQTIAQRTPAVAPETKSIMAVAITIFPPARSAKRDESRAIDPKYRGKAQAFDSCVAVAVPCVAFKGAIPLRIKQGAYFASFFLGCCS